MIAPSEPASGPARPSGLFGHPRGLAFLVAAELWERFAYYGVRALLALYMVKYMLVRDAGDVIGLAILRHGFEALSGPLEPQPLASQIYGLYTGLIYFTPTIGGILADRVLGQRRTVILGASLMVVGHFMMAFENLFLIALLTLILGNGAFKPNMSAQVGSLYPPGDPRRDRAYSIFYVGINIGAFLAPLVCGTLGEAAGWHYGFMAAGAGMLVSLCIYLLGLKSLPPDRTAAPASNANGPPAHNERHAIVSLCVLFVPVTLFWAAFEQQGNTIALWVDANTDRTLDLVFLSVEIPTTWFQAVNPLMVFAFTPFVLAFWRAQERRGREPSSTIKMGFGCMGVAVSYLVLVAAALSAGNGKASWPWLFAYFTIITVGELYISPIGLSLVSKVAPAHYVSMLMGAWFTTSFAGNLMAGWLGSFWSDMSKAQFFAMIAAVAGIAGLLILMLDRPLRPALRG